MNGDVIASIDASVSGKRLIVVFNASGSSKKVSVTILKL